MCSCCKSKQNQITLQQQKQNKLMKYIVPRPLSLSGQTFQSPGTILPEQGSILRLRIFPQQGSSEQDRRLCHSSLTKWVAWKRCLESCQCCGQSTETDQSKLPYWQFIWSYCNPHFVRISRRCDCAKLWGENCVYLLQCLHTQLQSVWCAPNIVKSFDFSVWVFWSEVYVITND